MMMHPEGRHQDKSWSGIVRLSKVEVYPQYLDEYMKYAAEVGEISLRTEPGVLTRRRSIRTTYSTIT